MSTLPAHARASHRFESPRLMFRSAIPSDAKAVCVMRSEAMNNPFGGVVNPDQTAEVQAENIEKQKGSTARGENAWLQVILKPEFTEHIVDDLLVSDGVLIGMSGYNSFPLVEIPGGKLLTADIGAMIDYRYARRGFALETMQAVIEYGFGELSCERIVCFTFAVNAPWRALMGTLGLEGCVKINRLEGGEEEAEYRFGKGEWETGKRGLREGGKWLL